LQIRSTGSGLDDNALFASVVMPHIDAAYQLARWLTGNRADAEDVVQDALLRAFRATRGFAGSGARAWVLSIVRNSAYSWLRKNRPGVIVTVEDLEAVEAAQPNQGQADVATPEAALIAKTDASASARQSRHCQRRSERCWCCATSRALITARSPR
jgi:RNA polymerase sigma factor (sigma-70 family)